MSKLKLNLLIVACLLLGQIHMAHAEATYVQQLLTNVPTVVQVTALNQNLAIGAIDGPTGNSTSPLATYRLQTNGTDNTYDYVITALIRTFGDVTVNAYAQIAGQAYILLGSNGSPTYPTIAAVNNIKLGSPVAANNAYVIAYPVTNILSNLASATLSNLPNYGGLCFVVKTGTSQDGTLIQKVGTAPLANSYSIANDLANVYEVVIKFSANPKP